MKILVIGTLMITMHTPLSPFVWINSWIFEHFSFLLLWFAHKTGRNIFVFGIILEQYLKPIGVFTKFSFYRSSLTRPFWRNKLRIIEFIIFDLSVWILKLNCILKSIFHLICLVVLKSLTVWFILVKNSNTDFLVDERSSLFLRL